jgi:hypothetical protein
MSKTWFNIMVVRHQYIKFLLCFHNKRTAAVMVWGYELYHSIDGVPGSNPPICDIVFLTLPVARILRDIRRSNRSTETYQNLSRLRNSRSAKILPSTESGWQEKLEAESMKIWKRFYHGLTVQSKKYMAVIRACTTPSHQSLMAYYQNNN